MSEPHSAAAEHATQLSPDAIMQLGLGFWGSKTLLSAVELGLFSELAEEGRSMPRRCASAWACTRAARPTSSTRSSRSACSSARTVATRTPRRPSCSSTAAKPSYVGGMLEMANARLYGFWGSLTEGLRTGAPQNEAKDGGDFFEALYADPARLARFARAMSAVSGGAGAGDRSQVPLARSRQRHRHRLRRGRRAGAGRPRARAHHRRRLRPARRSSRSSTPTSPASGSASA